MNRYHLLHVTEFVYDGPVSESYNEVRLRPIHDDSQSCLSFRLTTQPASPAFSYRDSLGNWVHQINILPVHNRLSCASRVGGADARHIDCHKLDELERTRSALRGIAGRVLRHAGAQQIRASSAGFAAAPRTGGVTLRWYHCGLCAERFVDDLCPLPIRKGCDPREFVD